MKDLDRVNLHLCICPGEDPDGLDCRVWSTIDVDAWEGVEDIGVVELDKSSSQDALE